MRLTTHTDYALRTLMYLATKAERATATQVAEFFGISVDHMAKVVNKLARLGYLRSLRGIGGGIELARAPQDIRLGEVIVAIEGNMHLLECVAADNVCVIESFCKLKKVLAEAERIQLAYLHGVTLADVIPKRGEMLQVGSAF